ncbi:MAG TPA: hypothetical protein VIY49_26695 [Bryobacteraceae bacterium]
MKPSVLGLLCAAICAVLSFGQTATTKVGPTPKVDVWERSKDCWEQAQKMMVSRWPAGSTQAPTNWSNHYSARYDKCFVTTYDAVPSKDEKAFPTLYTKMLFDAFERSGPLARACSTAHADCVTEIKKVEGEEGLDEISRNLNGKPYANASPAEQEAARNVLNRLSDGGSHDSIWCAIDGKGVDCAKAESFISERMRN